MNWHEIVGDHLHGMVVDHEPEVLVCGGIDQAESVPFTFFEDCLESRSLVVPGVCAVN
jgi:hypothetical protein